MSRTIDPRKLQDLLSKQLSAEGLEADLVPIPAQGDRNVRIRTLEEAIEDFEREAQPEQISYLVRVRLSAPAIPSGMSVTEAAERVGSRSRANGAQPAPQPPSANPESLYLADGRPNVTAFERNARLLFDSGDFALARNIWQTLLQTGERADLAHRGIAVCFEAEGKIPDAVRHYEDSIAYQPTLEAYQRLSQILIRNRKDQEAAETLQRALVLRDLTSETQAELHKACGNCWLRAEKPVQAEKHYRSALTLAPTNDAILTNYGALDLQLGRVAEAKAKFEAAVQANPKNDQAMSGIGACHLASGEKRQAHDAFARTLEINLLNSNAVFHLVKCAYELKTYATAARLLEEYVQSAPINANLLYSLAGMQYHLNRRPEARATCLKILEMQPGHSGAKDLLQLIGS